VEGMLVEVMAVNGIFSIVVVGMEKMYEK